MTEKYKPNQKDRDLVSAHGSVGTPQDIIAEIIGVDPKTLRKYYRAELDLAKHKANAVVGGALYNKAKSGDTAAMIFWMKTRAGWKEKQEVDLTSSDGSMSPTPAIVVSEKAAKALADKLIGLD